MKIFKRLLAALLCGAVAAGTAGCGQDGKSDSGKIKIVCTTFPAYDWVRELAAGREDEVDITYLLGRGTDMHSFQPTAEDILSISGCDLFVYVGGESDKWAEDALKGAANKEMKTVNMLDTIGSAAKAEEVKEGMQAEEEEEEEAEDEFEYDEHVWLSVRNAETICEDIAGKLSELDRDGKDKYSENLKAYSEKLDALDSDFKALAESAKEKTLIFGDRFPFRYFVEDYGFDYYAAFVGCSAETEASFETVTFLSEKLDAAAVKKVFKIENSDGRIAQAVIDSSKSKDAQIVTLDSVQSVTDERAADGESYLNIMRGNLDTLKEALE